MFSIPGDCDLRGDYRLKADDWTVDQDWGDYSAAEHDRWRRLYARQAGLVDQFAAREVADGLAVLNAADTIPDFRPVSRRLQNLTGWTLVAVPGLIPNDVFFRHLSMRRFPVCRWLREEVELDYLVEPDVFHDFFGHVPLLADPVFAYFAQAYGVRGPAEASAGRLDHLTRLYWYMVEFGLIATPDGFKAFGAGLLSSAAEIRHATTGAARRMPFDAGRILRTTYRIDAFQRAYFVLQDFSDLFRALNDPGFDALLSAAVASPDLSPESD